MAKKEEDQIIGLGPTTVRSITHKLLGVRDDDHRQLANLFVEFNQDVGATQRVLHRICNKPCHLSDGGEITQTECDTFYAAVPDGYAMAGQVLFNDISETAGLAALTNNIVPYFMRKDDVCRESEKGWRAFKESKLAALWLVDHGLLPLPWFYNRHHKPAAYVKSVLFSAMSAFSGWVEADALAKEEYAARQTCYCKARDAVNDDIYAVFEAWIAHCTERYAFCFHEGMWKEYRSNRANYVNRRRRYNIGIWQDMKACFSRIRQPLYFNACARRFMARARFELVHNYATVALPQPGETPREMRFGDNYNRFAFSRRERDVCGHNDTSTYITMCLPQENMSLRLSGHSYFGGDFEYAPAEDGSYRIKYTRHKRTHLARISEVTVRYDQKAKEFFLTVPMNVLKHLPPPPYDTLYVPKEDDPNEVIDPEKAAKRAKAREIAAAKARKWPYTPDFMPLTRGILYYKTSLANSTEKTEYDVRDGLRLLSIDLNHRPLVRATIYERQGANAVELSEHVLGDVANSLLYNDIRDAERYAGRLKTAITYWKALKKHPEETPWDAVCQLDFYKLGLSSEQLIGTDENVRAGMTEEQRDRVDKAKKKLQDPATVYNFIDAGITRLAEFYRDTAGAHHFNGAPMAESLAWCFFLSVRRQLLISWARKEKPPRAAGVRGSGTFFSKSRIYLANFKENLLKKLTRCVVNLALDEKCHAIAAEDLSNFKQSAKQERSQNRALALWSPREIARMLKMQCELYGIAYVELDPRLSSQIDPRTRQLGFRPHGSGHLSKEHLYVEREQLAAINSDSAGTHNLQATFWTRGRDISYIPARRTPDGTYVPVDSANEMLPTAGKRKIIQGAFLHLVDSLYAVLRPRANSAGAYDLVAATRQEYSRYFQATLDALPDVTDPEVDDEAIEDKAEGFFHHGDCFLNTARHTAWVARLAKRVEAATKDNKSIPVQPAGPGSIRVS